MYLIVNQVVPSFWTTQSYPCRLCVSGPVVHPHVLGKTATAANMQIIDSTNRAAAAPLLGGVWLQETKHAGVVGSVTNAHNLQPRLIEQLL
jgi:hypothetical protein